MNIDETKKLNVYEKMLLITEELGRVSKNLSVGFGKSSYKAVGEADVLAAVKPLEVKYRIYSYPHSRNLLKQEEMISTVATEDQNGNIETKDKMTIFIRIETVYRFVNIDNSSEYVDIATYGDGVDSQDKSPGKAMTYADKYALLKAYKIETGEDPDSNPSKDLKKPIKAAITEEQISEFNSLGVNQENVLNKFKVKNITELTKEQADFVIKSKKEAVAKLQSADNINPQSE